MTEASRIQILARYWENVVGTVDHVEVNERINDDAGWNARYLFMTTMSAGIAVLGLIQSSPAVVIGAMLISPLMGPIIGLGFALATVDAQHIRRAALALAAGSLVAILFCAALVLVSPIQNVTSEIAARTRPNLFDLIIALFSAMAGTYATIRGRAGTIVGVAIATALMPPLATVGFGLATWNWPVFSGALLLFVTNFVTITLTAAVMARMYGFGPTLSPRQSMVQTLAILGTFMVLAVPLGLSLRQLAWEGLALSTARGVVGDTFKEARISQLDLDYAADPLKLTATVLTPEYRGDADLVVTKTLQQQLGRPVDVDIEQYRVGHGNADAASVQSAQTQAARRDSGGDVADRLALVAGVDTSAILIDRTAKRARVRATLLPGATLAAYHLLEMRVAATEPGWQVELVPPAVSPGTVGYTGDAPSAQGRAALAEAIWAARRNGLALSVSGPSTQANALVDQLTKAGVTAVRGNGGGDVRLSWAVPPSTAATAPAPPQ